MIYDPEVKPFIDAAKMLIVLVDNGGKMTDEEICNAVATHDWEADEEHLLIVAERIRLTA